MKHTDTLLGIIEEEKRRTDNTRDEAHKRLQALQELQRHPGWQLFLERLRADRANALLQLARADRDQLAKVTGILLQVESALVWLDDTATELQAILSD